MGHVVVFVAVTQIEHLTLVLVKLLLQNFMMPQVVQVAQISQLKMLWR